MLPSRQGTPDSTRMSVARQLPQFGCCALDDFCHLVHGGSAESQYCAVVAVCCWWCCWLVRGAVHDFCRALADHRTSHVWLPRQTQRDVTSSHTHRANPSHHARACSCTHHPKILASFSCGFITNEQSWISRSPYTHHHAWSLGPATLLLAPGTPSGGSIEDVWPLTAAYGSCCCPPASAATLPAGTAATVSNSVHYVSAWERCQARLSASCYN